MILRFWYHEYAQTAHACSVLNLRRSLAQKVSGVKTPSSAFRQRQLLDDEDIPRDATTGLPQRYFTYKGRRVQWSHPEEFNKYAKSSSPIGKATPFCFVILFLGIAAFIFIKRSIIESRKEEMFERVKEKRAKKLAEQAAAHK